ncbi:MAG: acyl-CoA dehydrogenase family protein [Rhodoblastus sp.]
MALQEALLQKPATESALALREAVRQIATSELSAQVLDIDKGHYPAETMRAFGKAGAWATHLAPDGKSDLREAIATMSIISQTCTSTGFMAWCQDTLGWYVLNTDNVELRERLLPRIGAGQQLGGTGLSNPMKTFYAIEQLRLKAKRVKGGYSVRGILPWVSNLGPDHLFGAICEVEEDGQRVMVLADCAGPGVTLKPCEPFLAMDGTGTYAVQFRDAFVPDSMVLAHEAMSYVKKVRAGFLLLQFGMAFGLIRDCIAMMREVKPALGHINSYLPEQPEQFAETLEAVEAEIMNLAKTPYETDIAYWRRIIELRLAGGEACVAAANAAMLHCGARGYVAAHRAQRRLREAWFIAIVTPATKQLRKMLADTAH